MRKCGVFGLKLDKLNNALYSVPQVQRLLSSFTLSLIIIVRKDKFYVAAVVCVHIMNLHQNHNLSQPNYYSFLIDSDQSFLRTPSHDIVFHQLKKCFKECSELYNVLT